MSRLDLIRDAQRPKMSARALFQGPQGSGKTWTMLSVARLLAGPDGHVYLYDTERESALTYADVFAFRHLPWRPPYDPAELTGTLDAHARDLTDQDVLIVDSFSHFWQGTGGILDIANGRVQGGWDKARPIQNALIEQILAMPCHVLLGARMKNTVLVSDGGKTIENIGLTIVQDDALAYELNIVVQLDAHHSVTVMKSRTPAVPVGRVYPGGYEKKLADDYAEWLAGGIPPANREDVEAIVAVFGGMADREARAALKEAFVAEFGMPHSLSAEAIPAVRAWLDGHGAPVGEGPAANIDGEAPQSPQEPPTDADSPEPAAAAGSVPDPVTPAAMAALAAAYAEAHPEEAIPEEILRNVLSLNREALIDDLHVVGEPGKRSESLTTLRVRLAYAERPLQQTLGG